MRVITPLQQLRILALPLTSRSVTTGKYTYYHFQTFIADDGGGGKKNEPSGLMQRLSGKASQMWAGFGKAPKGSWKYRTFEFGERVVDRIDFEELALKSMDPSLWPKYREMESSKLADEKATRTHSSIATLVHPTFYGMQTSPLTLLHDLLKRRTPKHRQGFYFWMLISPFTLPFGLVPIVPNLPLFFCAWRSWHHYRAYKSSEYLETLLESGAIEAEPNADLDRIYKDHPASDHPLEQCLTTPPNEEEHLILSRDAVPVIVNTFDLPSSAEADLDRALNQTLLRLGKKADV